MATVAGDQNAATPTSSQFVGTSACDVMQPIKNEPPIDIDDICSENTNSNDEALKPKIRLTPTNKLLASPIPNKHTSKGMNNNTNCNQASPIPNIKSSRGMYNDYQGHPYLSSTKVEGKKKFVCPYENCEKSYGKSSHLRSHLTWHTGIKPFVCHEPSCGKGFTRSDELNRHTRTHTGEKPFECVQCSKKFSRSDHLSKHLVTHVKQLASGGVTFHINKPMPAKREATLSSNTLPALACLPTYTQNSESAATSHANGQAEISGNNNIAANNSPTSSNATAELSNDELIVPVLIPQIEIKEEGDDDDNGIVNEQNNDNEIMPEANALPIIAAGTNISNQATASSASKLTTAERQYACDSCEKSFRRNDDLTRHRRIHTGAKPYACPDCDRRFMRNDHLKKHMNTHTRSR